MKIICPCWRRDQTASVLDIKGWLVIVRASAHWTTGSYALREQDGKSAFFGACRGLVISRAGTVRVPSLQRGENELETLTSTESSGHPRNGRAPRAQWQN